MYSTLHQQKTGFTVPREDFLYRIVYNDNLKKKDLRVALLLMTQLEGCKPKQKNTSRDYGVFRKVDIKTMAIELEMTKEEVRSAIEHLIDEDILEKGTTDTIKTGYRFTI